MSKHEHIKQFGIVKALGPLTMALALSTPALAQDERLVFVGPSSTPCKIEFVAGSSGVSVSIYEAKRAARNLQQAIQARVGCPVRTP